MKFLLLLALLPAFARAEYIEIRKVVEPGQGTKVMELVRTIDGEEQKEQLTLSGELIVGEKDIVTAHARQEGSSYMIDLVLTSEAGGKLSEATGEPEKQPRFAVIIDGKIVTAPIAHSRISTNLSITGFNSMKEAEEVAAKLKSKAAEK